MTGADAIRYLISQNSGWSQNKLGAALGFSKQVMYDRLHSSDIKAGFLADACAAMGYHLAILPPGTKLPTGAVEIEGIK